MKKEEITIEKVKHDLCLYASYKISNIFDWRSLYFIPVTFLAVVVGVLLKNIWIGLAIFSVAAYHIAIYVTGSKQYKDQKREIKKLINSGGISITLYKLGHISTETIYEPHLSQRIGRRSIISNYKEVKYYNFTAGGSWRLPKFTHYSWSKDYYMSGEGLENISLQGDEFYHVALRENHDIAYIYPCKFFELDDDLKIE